jgi:hypothetical protein
VVLPLNDILYLGLALLYVEICKFDSFIDVNLFHLSLLPDYVLFLPGQLLVVLRLHVLDSHVVLPVVDLLFYLDLMPLLSNIHTFYLVVGFLLDGPLYYLLLF